ncbi:hypothetical protein JCM10212_006208 [Sporobolomyces blumeae]
MADTTFAYHPPGLSPTRFAAAVPPPHTATGPPSHSHSPLFSHSRPSSSAGPYGLPPLQEHPQDGENENEGDGLIQGGRPQLVGFEQLTGEIDGEGALADPAGSAASGAGVGGEAAQGGGAPTFRDPFHRPPSSHSTAANGGGTYPGSNPAFGAFGSSAIAGPSQHAFYNPHPTVNVRNTRPMTAPSGAGYYQHASAYSAAPSAFYAPQQTTGLFDPLAAAPAGYSYPLASVADSAYAKARPPGDFADPLHFRSSFSSASGEDASPTGSTPFFYAPPATGAIAPPALDMSAPPIRTPSGSYYPAVMDPSAATGQPATALSLARPNTAESIDLGHSTRRRSSTGSGKQYNFVQQAGQTTKRPRRRYDEIERLYNCDYPGCTKAYGTLNHLNSHKTMQKHGPKSTPAQFKEMRKAWRERKKAEAAAAARERASEPPNPQNLPTTTDPLGGVANGGSERPRPSTSAGEYHFTMSAPMLPPNSLAGPPTFPQPLLPPVQPTFADTYGAHFPSPLHSVYNDPYAARPVTAPSHFVPPSFGQPLSTSVSDGSTMPSPQTFQSPTFNLVNTSPRYSTGPERRFSLPAPTLHHQFASPEVKMPQPVLGYNPSALLNGSAGSTGLGFGAGLSNGKMSNGASHGGAPEDGTFGAIKEDVEGEEPSRVDK